MEYIKSDRKQVFGSEVLDDSYMQKIERICSEQVRSWTLGTEEITQPLTQWVRQ
ncbi:MAG TPA: hypothetical protein VJB66_02650 [Candidatus Nanoarchaeia archaeon]|nr:hypothetical protein [Candidatus Nanoarchaeia archaeon]